ncbi:MAG: chalcone isomerase family protein [Planctomycetia bacterium]|nr:chalcone isomerase family protein [Planctomycetia bacterium]
MLFWVANDLVEGLPMFSMWVKRTVIAVAVLGGLAVTGAIVVSGSVRGFIEGFRPGPEVGDTALTASELIPALETKPPAGVAPVAAEQVAQAAIEHEGIFPVVVRAEVGGKPAEMRLTGQAIRKAFGIKFYKIGSYCCETISPTNVDALAAADVPKQLLLVMERDVSEAVLSRSFRETFEKNDPDKKFVKEIQTMLDYMTSSPLKKGEHVLITHLPQTGVSVRGRNQDPITVDNPAFAEVVWNVYMGPKGVSDELRTGLGTRLKK